MGRLPRLQFPGACYHIVLKGDGGDPLFTDDADRAKALALLAEMKKRFHVRLYAWCLLPSSIELAVETPDGNLARAMQGFGTSYTKYFNARRRRAGHVFGGRYLSALVDKGEALAELTRRIHLAPVQAAGERPTRYAWSSCRAYTENVKHDGLVDTDTILRQFGRSRFRQSVKYLKFLTNKPVLSAIDLNAALRGEPLSPHAGRGSRTSAGEGTVGALVDFEELLRDAAAAHHVTPEDIRSRFRTDPVCRARRQVALKAWEAGVKVAEIATALQKSPAAVSRMVRRQEKPADSALPTQ